MSQTIDFIAPEVAGTLPGLFLERVRRSPAACAYRRFDRSDRCCDTTTWQQAAAQAACWQESLRGEGLKPGDRVAVMLKNSLEWVLFDLAALGLGLVTVPLFVNDRAENVAYIVDQTEARLLLIEGSAQWVQIGAVARRLESLTRIVTVDPLERGDDDPRVRELSRWLCESESSYHAGEWEPDALASIVYTSGTTGNPKGVMLSHRNILTNAYSGLNRVSIYTEDLFLSFLPLSHTLERTAGYYVPLMAGACVAHVRSLEKLPEDLKIVQPTVIVSVPRVFERVHKRIVAGLKEGPVWKRKLFFLAVRVGWRRFKRRQGEAGWSLTLLLWPLLKRLVADRVLAALGGRVRISISGGAPLNPETARLFIALGLDVLQGYGLTETSPVVAVNSIIGNHPDTVGKPLDGVEVRIAEDGELLVRGPNLMAGYWKNPEATAAVIDAGGWFHTGDLAALDPDGRIAITGRLKEIIVLSTGEKIAPADLEMAIAVDPLFEQVLVVGEGRPFLTALVVLNEEKFRNLRTSLQLEPEAHPNDPRLEPQYLDHVAACITRFPGFAQIWKIHATLEPWEVTDGLITATMKLRRKQLHLRYEDEIERLYAGH